MVKAGALYYAILMSFLISLLSGLLILGVWYHHNHTNSLIQSMRMERKLNSALLLAMETPELVSVGQSKTIDVFNDSTSMVKLTSSFWGGYTLLKVETQWRNTSISKISLCGNDVFSDESIALYLSDKERYLSVSGSTLLKGTCYLPKLGIRRAYIEGMSFTGEKMVDGTSKISKPELPELNPLVINCISNYILGNILPDDSLANIAFLSKSDSITNSFYKKSIVFYSDHWITLSGKYLQGNIKIISKKGITLQPTAKLNDILLFAPKIEVESDMIGTLQLFASDTLRINDGVFLTYPSMVVLLENGCKKPLIQIGQKCTILGDIVMYSKSFRQQTECWIGNNTEVQGKVYCSGKVELKGMVNGSLYCDGFVLRTPTSTYENNLLNATINYTMLSKQYAGSLFYKNSPHFKQIKWEY